VQNIKANGQVINSSSIIVQGRINPGPDIVVEMNNTPAAIHGDKYVSGPVDIIEGPNDITILERIGDTIVEEEIVTIILDSTAPLVQVIEPSPDSVHNNQNIPVSASVLDEGQVWVSINNLPVMRTRDVYEAVLHLSEGMNTIVITAVDYAGNRNEVVIENVMVDITP